MITTLRLENFLPFRDRVELPMGGQGLVLVRGRNTVSAALDSNGVGKSSIVHGISFCLFGEDLAGRRADAVACRFTAGTCEARVDMVDALGEWGVLRTRRPTALKVYGIPGVAENEDAAMLQAKIEQRLGFGLRTFKNAVVFGQGAFERFAGAEQAEQMRMLDEIQGIDFRAARGRAILWRDQLQAKLAEAARVSRNAGVHADASEQSARVMRTVRDEYESSRAEQLALLQNRQDLARKRLDAFDAEAKSHREDALNLSVLRSERERLRALAAECIVLEDAANGVARRADRAASRLVELSSELDELFAAGACPTCRQPVKTRQKAIAKLFEHELAELKRADDVAGRELEKAQQAFEDAAVRHKVQVVKLDGLLPSDFAPHVKADPVGQYIARLEEQCSPQAVLRRAEQVKEVRGDLTRANEEYGATRSTVWGGQASLDAAEDTTRVSRAEVRAADEQATRISGAVSVADYWVEAFGDRGIRSMLVDGVADFVNERVASHLEVLAAGEATVRMSAQTELKKGGARERISFATDWAWGGAGPLDGSGGQDRRRDLAVFAAVQDLAESRSARPFPLKIFDEPFDALDARGKELACGWVKLAAHSHGTALLVTHDEGIAATAEADRVWTVVMGRGGAHVEIT